MPNVCSVEGCDRGPIKARGWCSTHYSRWQRNGDVAADVPVNTDLSSPSQCGTPGKYRLGCRCRLCTQAATELARRYRTNAMERGLPPDDRRHGTPTAYVTYRCRCDRCRQWCSSYAPLRIGRSRRRARLRGVESEPYTLDEIAERDGWRCQLCRRKVNTRLSYPDPMSASIDHIIPISQDGDDTRANVQLAHLRCNAAKGNRGTDQLRLVG